MKISTEYQAMGMHVAWEDEADPETRLQGYGSSPSLAIRALLEAMVEERGRELDHVEAQRDEALAKISDVTRERDQAYERIAEAARHLRFTAEHEKDEGELPCALAILGSITTALFTLTGEVE